MPKKSLITFDTHPKSQFWSHKNIIKPFQVALNSHSKFWFKCDKCLHEFEARCDHIVVSKSWCPYCSNQKLCECDICFQKSIAANLCDEKLACWLYEKNNKLPRYIFRHSSCKYWFKCNKCFHEFYTSISNISNNKWCPYCSHKKLCDDDNCQFCFLNSFASHYRSQFASVKNKKRPRSLFLNSGELYKFDCHECNREFETKISYVNNMNSWCPNCSKSKTEKIVRSIFEKYFNTTFPCVRLDTFKNPKTNFSLELDGYNENLQIAFEYNGIQHYEFTPYFHKNKENLFKQQERDELTRELCKKHGITLIEIPYKYNYKNQNELEQYIITQLKLKF